MIHKGRSVSIAIVLSLTVGLSVNPVTAEPISTSFTYQGQLKQGGVPVNDTCDIQLTLWDDLAAGIQVGPTLTFNGGTGNAPPVGVVNGLFHVELDFGGDAFAGDARWLQVAVCCTSPCATSFTTLSPRQPLTATPFALHTRGITSNETGYIGIGTNSPAYPLEVRTSSADAAIFGSNNTVVPVSPAPFSPEGAIAGGALGAGVYGESFAINGKGVQGEAHADTGNGVGLIGRSRADAGFGVFGIATKPTGFTVGVEGRSASIDGIGVHGVVSDPANVGSGVRGLNFSADGVGVLGENWGTSGGRAVGVEGNSDGVDGIGVVGLAKALTGIGVGVQGESDSIDGTGVVGTSKRKGVIGEASDTEDVTAFGVTGRAASPHGIGVLGEVSAETGFAIGVKGTTASDEGKGVEGKHESITGAGFGVVGSSLSPDAIGVAGYHFAETGTEPGVFGETKSNVEDAAGVLGVASSTTGLTFGGKFVATSPEGIGVFGNHDAVTGVEAGVYGQTSSVTDDATGVEGRAVGVSGITFGGLFASVSPDGTGVLGDATATSGVTAGVWGRASSPDGVGVFGDADATTGQNFGVTGISDSPDGIGVYGYHRANFGDGEHAGVYGETNSSGFHASGVFGRCNGVNGIGVHGHGGNTGVSGTGASVGVYGSTDLGSGHGVWSAGACFIDGDLTVNFGDARISQNLVVDSNIICGSLDVRGAKSFKIDHPLDPANKYLTHYCTEGPEPLLMYRGNATLDEKGEAWVTLPTYFEEINRDFQYQLTSIGSFSPVYVAQKVEGNRFKIAGGKSGSEISWTVTGVRNDPYMRKHGAPVEHYKSEQDRGKYLQPDLYGKPKEMGVHYKALPLDYKRLARRKSGKKRYDISPVDKSSSSATSTGVAASDVATLSQELPMNRNVSASTIKALITRKLSDSRRGQRAKIVSTANAISKTSEKKEQQVKDIK